MLKSTSGFLISPSANLLSASGDVKKKLKSI